MEKLNDQQIDDKLSKLTGWRVEGDSLKIEFEFADFNEAMAFMNRVAETANRLSHHPDWSNSYNKVAMSLTSHEAGGITAVDFELATAASAAYEPSKEKD